MRRSLLLLLIFCWPVAAQAQEAIPRVIIAVYDSDDEYSPRYTYAHRFMEMPANHLGYDLHYQDIRKSFPPIGPEVTGVLVWLAAGTEVPNPIAYLDWLRNAQVLGRKVIIIESVGLSEKHRKDPAIAEKLSQIFAGLGVRDDNSWYSLTYDARIVSQDKELTGFERQYGPNLPAFGGMRVLPGRAASHLRVAPSADDEPVDLVVTSPGGGLIAEGYAFFFQDVDDPRVMQLYINPFAFLKKALATPFAPIPDTTTLGGKRIFYSHIDGDGWNNISEIPSYSKNNTLSAEVIRREILEPYRDFAFDVGLITADVDKECFGVDTSEQAARAIFALPNVEPSTHTHSHPLYWRFFNNYVPEKEKPYLSLYPARPSTNRSMTDAIRTSFDDSFSKGSGSGSKHTDGEAIKLGREDLTDEKILDKYYTTPRSYACTAFDLDQEVAGSVKRIEELAPPGKKVKLLQWSGDTSPFEGAVAKARENGLYNINGGDSRFDKEYPSYAWVAPIGLRIGNERQVYSSNSNENTYTNLWTGRFFGFRYLQTTVENTESPRRIHPFNLYFHIFSGQKQASLDAIKANLIYARSLPLTPILASHYAAIANGFYSSRVIPQGPLSWKITDRGALSTFRFDDADNYDVNLSASEGLMGFRHHQGSLYIAVDPDAENVTISLTDKSKSGTSPSNADTPYLIESRWSIKGLRNSKKSLTFAAQGYGKGIMVWNVDPKVEYGVTAVRQDKTLFNAQFLSDDQGNLAIDFGDTEAIEPLEVTLTKGK